MSSLSVFGLVFLLHLTLSFQYDVQFSKEIEEVWGSLCGRWVNNIHEILGYLIALAGVIGSSEVLVHVSHARFVCSCTSKNHVLIFVIVMKIVKLLTDSYKIINSTTLTNCRRGCVNGDTLGV